VQTSDNVPGPANAMLLSTFSSMKRQAPTKARNSSGYKGLPLGFLLAGSSCVIETLWPVEHDCRVIFWSRFFDNLITDGKDVSETLCLTQVNTISFENIFFRTLNKRLSILFCVIQLWLRDATEIEYLRSYPKELNNARINQRIEVLVANETSEDRVGRNAPPFRSPYFWGGFNFWGDGMVSGQKKKSEAKKMYDYQAAASKYAVSPSD
jgi:CHAT domain-containing protein